jgi:hypothetical protein
MRSTFVLATALVASLVLPTSAAFAQGIEIGPRGVEVNPGPPPPDRHWSAGDCEELRAACLHKEELGEEGQGNCQRYRAVCGRD